MDISQDGYYGYYILSGSEDKKVKLWFYKDHECYLLNTYSKSKGGINSV